MEYLSSISSIIHSFIHMCKGDPKEITKFSLQTSRVMASVLGEAFWLLQPIG